MESHNKKKSKMYPEIHLDLVAVILSRLPIESLKRFIRVSKAFRDMIFYPSFVKIHHQQSMKETYLLASEISISHDSLVIYQLNMQSYEPRRLTELIPDEDLPSELFNYVCPISCDIICFTTTESKIYVCNPSIERLKHLPKPSTPSFKYSKIGFVYSSSTSEYKVVHLFLPPNHDRSKKNEGMECETFTFGFHRKVSSSSWMTTRVRCPCRVYYNSASTDGKIYWLIRNSYNTPSYGQKSNHDLIVSFNSVTETFKTISRPPTWPSKKYKDFNFELMAVEGNLCITDIKRTRRTSMLDIWMLRGNSSWEQFYSIDLLSNFGSELCDHRMFIPQNIYCGEIIFLQNIFSNDDSRTETYNIEHNTLRTLFPIDHIGVSWESLLDVEI